MKHELGLILKRYEGKQADFSQLRAMFHEISLLHESLPDFVAESCNGGVSTSDFKYAKMQTIHQLLVNTVSRPTDSTEKAVELARMVHAAFAAIDAPDMGEVSDGYHTFNELYAHRVRLFSTLMSAHADQAWWSHLHHDGSQWEGWVIAGIDTPAGPVTYHLPVTEVPILPEGTELDRGKEWDGHTAADVLERLKSL